MGGGKRSVLSGRVCVCVAGKGRGGTRRRGPPGVGRAAAQVFTASAGLKGGREGKKARRTCSASSSSSSGVVAAAAPILSQAHRTRTCAPGGRACSLGCAVRHGCAVRERACMCRAGVGGVNGVCNLAGWAPCPPPPPSPPHQHTHTHALPHLVGAESPPPPFLPPSLPLTWSVLRPSAWQARMARR